MFNWFLEKPKYIFICDCAQCDGLGNNIELKKECECCKTCLHGTKFVIK